MDLSNICDNRIFDKKYMIKLSLNQELKNNIIEATNWLHISTPLKIRALTINKGYTQETFPKCKCCNNYVTYDKAYQNSLNTYCSSECSRSDKKRLSVDTYNKLNNYEWLYEQRIVQQKSFEELAVELNCSPIPVKRACKILKIPHVRYNESNSLIKSYLKNKEWLYQKHIIERKKCEDIAELIGSTPATVSRFLKFHNIIANKSNSYDRKINKQSGEEKQLASFISSLGVNIKTSDRSILNGSEIDIVVPELKMAFEYNGMFSHVYRPEETSEALKKGQFYHLNKTTKCKEQGYTLIHIFSDDWKYRNEICKSIIRSKLGFTDRIFARKCNIKPIDKKTKKRFLNKNHIQGNDRSTVWLGLFYNEELVSVMTFNKSRFNKNYDWELTRFCNKLNYTIVGGFSKLLKYFRKQYKGSIVSYADISRSEGNVYSRNNFKLIRVNRPNYSYVNFKYSEQRMHRYNFRKSIIAPNSNQTEEDVMREKGYYKVWGCGTMCYVLE